MKILRIYSIHETIAIITNKNGIKMLHYNKTMPIGGEDGPVAWYYRRIPSWLSCGSLRITSHLVQYWVGKKKECLPIPHLEDGYMQAHLILIHVGYRL